jgi:hypothetical protein
MGTEPKQEPDLGRLESGPRLPALHTVLSLLFFYLFEEVTNVVQSAECLSQVGGLSWLFKV